MVTMPTWCNNFEHRTSSAAVKLFGIYNRNWTEKYWNHSNWFTTFYRCALNLFSELHVLADWFCSIYSESFRSETDGPRWCKGWKLKSEGWFGKFHIVTSNGTWCLNWDLVRILSGNLWKVIFGISETRACHSVTSVEHKASTGVVMG
jgi:hypothetical protein